MRAIDPSAIAVSFTSTGEFDCGSSSFTSTFFFLQV
jgi:hypothetical protein